LSSNLILVVLVTCLVGRRKVLLSGRCLVVISVQLIIVVVSGGGPASLAGDVHASHEGVETASAAIELAIGLGLEDSVGEEGDCHCHDRKDKEDQDHCQDERVAVTTLVSVAIYEYSLLDD
jgi:hypothetical protein